MTQYIWEGLGHTVYQPAWFFLTKANDHPVQLHGAAEDSEHCGTHYLCKAAFSVQSYVSQALSALLNMMTVS